jgi:hypothetical protein
MNKHLLTVIVSTVLAASMPLSLLSGVKKPKAVRHQYVKPEMQALRGDLKSMKQLDAASRESIGRYVRDYVKNPSAQRMPKLSNANAQAIARRIITSYENIKTAPGNHTRSAENYLVKALGTIDVGPELAQIHASRSAEKSRKASSRTTKPTAMKKAGRGTTGLAGQLPASARASEAAKASGKKAAATSPAQKVKPLHEKRERKKAIKRERKAKRAAERRKKELKEKAEKRMALKSEIRRLKM